jgi:large subunit ribosomal protein L32
MAVPKKKVSRSRRDSRRAHNFRVVAPNLIPCPTCKAPILPHHVCDNCGQYQGRQVLNVEAEAAAK